MTMTDATAPEPDCATIQRHLEIQTARWHELERPLWIEIRAIGEGRDPYFARFRPSALDEAAEWAVGKNRLGRNIYAVQNPIGDHITGRAATDADIVGAVLVFADCDDAGAGERLRAFVGPRYRFGIVSGTRPHWRGHAYWELVDWIADLAEWTAIQKRIAAALGSDPRIFNPSRIMRVAGTVSYPAAHKRAKGYISEVASLRTEWPQPRGPVGIEDMRRAFPPAPDVPAPERPQAAPGGVEMDAGTFDAVDTEAAKARALSGDEWHNNMIRAVARWVAKGLTDEEIVALTRDWTTAGYTAEDTEREVRQAIRGARGKGWAPAENYAKPEDVDWGAIKAQEPAKPKEPAKPCLEWFDDIEPALSCGYLIKDVISEESMSVVYGASNAGKTFFVLDMTFHLAIGADWQGHRVRQGGVLYLAAEGGRGVLNRVAALRARHGVCDVPLAIRRAGLDLLKKQADLQHLVDLAAEFRERHSLSVLVIDTLSRVIAGGDENSAQDMTAFIRNVDALRQVIKCHVLIVHHTGKDAARGARGHSSLRAATDTEIEVTNDDGARAAFVTKQRDFSGGQVFGFDLDPVELGTDDDGDTVSSCVVKYADGEARREQIRKTKGLGGNQKIIAEAFDALVAEGYGRPNPGGVGMPAAGRFTCVQMHDLRRVAEGKMSGSDTRSGWNKAWAALTGKRGLFACGENLVWRTDREKSNENQ